MGRERSKLLFERAKALIPGGVNSPVRSFKAVDDTPFYVQRAKGAYIYDVDGNRYIDYVSSFGAIILGHSDFGLMEEVKKALDDGTSYGACHPYEIELAELIHDAIPTIELLRLTNSGTEATMSAIRLARAFTGRKNIIKFKGCYHGHADFLLTKAGSGMATFSQPDSLGVLEEHVRNTFVADFNDIESVRRLLEVYKDFACVIVEPIMGNMGVILPEREFLKELESLCRKEGILLIFDEVITGFRVTYGGAQSLYDIKPDLTCLGKIIGGGFPIGAFGGRREIMELLAPSGGVYQAGTLSGNPVAVRAGLYVLKYLRENKWVYEDLERKTSLMKKEILRFSEKYGVPYTVNSVCGMFSGFFSSSEVKTYDDALRIDRESYAKLFRLLLDSGVFFPPSPYEASFLTLSHGEEEIRATLNAFERAFESIGKDLHRN